MAQVKQQFLDEKAKEAERQDRKVGLLFSSPDGKEVLDILKRLFYDRTDFVKGDPYHTHLKIGQRDVVGYLDQCTREAANAVETS